MSSRNGYQPVAKGRAMADQLTGMVEDYQYTPVDVLPTSLSGTDWALVLLSTLAILLVLVSSS
jgi:hypothetical protein